MGSLDMDSFGSCYVEKKEQFALVHNGTSHTM